MINNTFNGCAASGGATPDIFVAACAPTFANGLPTQKASGQLSPPFLVRSLPCLSLPQTVAALIQGSPISVGQPFADGAIVGNSFVQHGEPHHAVELYGFSGLKVGGNTVELIPSSSSTSGVGVETELCGDVCGSFDGFDVTEQNGARVWGWAVDAKLTAPNMSSYVSLEVDGTEVWSVLACGSRPDLVGKVSKGPLHVRLQLISFSAFSCIFTVLIAGKQIMTAFRLLTSFCDRRATTQTCPELLLISWPMETTHSRCLPVGRTVASFNSTKPSTASTSSARAARSQPTVTAVHPSPLAFSSQTRSSASTTAMNATVSHVTPAHQPVDAWQGPKSHV